MSTARTRIVVNPAAGERHDQLSPTRARVTVFGAGRGARDPHVATGAETRLTVLGGRVAVTCDGTLSVLEPGQSIAIAPGVEHAWWSTRAGELCIEIESDAAQLDGQECTATGTTRSWRSWSWSSLAPIGWAPSASR
jgi:mannose-6-phosphate isomerase-like protein (cupin superfamily)